MASEETYVDGMAISDLRVVDLKEQLEKRGLSKSGSKTILVKRLKDQLALEKMQEEQAGKDPSNAPNMEMKACGNDLVAEYLEKQQEMLQAAKMAAARTAAASSSESPTTSLSPAAVSTPVLAEPENRLSSPTSRRSRSGRSKSTRQSITEQENAVGAGSLYSTPTAAASAVTPFSTPSAEVTEKTETVAVTETSAVVEAEIETPVEEPVSISTEKRIEVVESRVESALIEKESEKDESQPEADTGDATIAESTKNDVEESTTTIAEETSLPPAIEVTTAEVIEKAEIEIRISPQRQRSRSPSPDGSEAGKPSIESRAEVGSDQEEESRHRGVDEDERSEKTTSPSSGGGGGDDRDRDRGQDRIDDDSTDVVKVAVDESDDLEMEMSAPVNAADELFEAVNTATTMSTSGKKTSTEVKPEEISFSAIEKENRDIPQRKRKWVAATLPKRAAVSISSDSLKDIVGSVKDSVKEEEPKAVDETVESAPAPKRIVISRDVTSADESVTDLEADSQRERRVDIEAARPPDQVTEDGFVRANPPSPARHLPGNIIHIRGLSRPFTLPALHDLISKFGVFNKDEFWIDNIKSHCIVKYENESDAITARERLHNVYWPSSNGKMLRVDFATQEDLDRHRSQEVPAARVTQQSSEGEKERLSVSEKPAREVREIRKSERDDRGRRSASPRRDDLTRDRSWDRGKTKTWRSGESPPTDPRGAGGRKRVSLSPDGGRSDLKHDQPAQPAKLLDELFRKTKATPCIYWLPLSVEQIREKERERKKREQERFEKVRKIEDDERERERDRRREPYPRRQSPFPHRGRRR